MPASRILLIVLLLVALVSAAESQTFSGEGTQYTLTDPSNGNCNFMSFPEEAKTKYAALNKPQFKSTTNCGRCAQVSCVDDKCSSRASEIVHIVDQCPECVRGDLDLSPEVFQSITGHQNDRVKIQWKFVDCPVRGPIQYCLKDGSNNFWLAVQPTNFLVGIESLQVNGQDTTMVASAYYFLRDGKSATQTDLASLNVRLTSVNGEVLEETISLAGGGCVSSKYQFSQGRAADSPSDFEVEPTQARTSTPTPTPSPSETTPAPTPTPTSAPSPTRTPTASSSSSASGSGSDVPASKKLRGSEEPGVVEAPAPTPEPSETPTVDQTGIVREVTTRSDAGGNTSPVLMILLVLAGVCVFVLVVLALVVKCKRRLKRESEAKRNNVEHVSDLPRLMVKQSSYEDLQTPSRRADIAFL